MERSYEWRRLHNVLFFLFPFLKRELLKAHKGCAHLSKVNMCSPENAYTLRLIMSKICKYNIQDNVYSMTNIMMMVPTFHDGLNFISMRVRYSIGCLPYATSFLQ